MKAILLAAGVGKRFHTVTEQRPKCLIEVQGKSLLERTLSALAVTGIDEAVVVIGHLGEMIQQHIGTVYQGVRVTYIVNPLYNKGAILSLWSAREHFDDDILIMDADVLFPVTMLARLVRSPYASCFLLDASAANTGEEQMLLTRGGRVLDIVRGGRGDFDVIGESVGFFKVSRQDTPLLHTILKKLLADGQDGIEHEQAFSLFLAQREVGFETVDDLPWIEIDFPSDLAQAEHEILPRILALDERRG